MATSPAAAATRLVAVERFEGPGGNWYASRFEAMLANTTFDGQPWFALAAYADPASGERAGVYGGEIDITNYSAWEDYRTVSKCVEWDGPFDCETRIDIEEVCYHDDVSVQVTPRLIELGTGRVLFTKAYGGSASSEACFEMYDYSKDGQRGHRKEHSRHGHGGYGPAPFGISGLTPPRDLVLEALSDTLHPIRIDIAPRNAVVRATFVTEAVDPMVRADPRFKQAVKAGARDPAASCTLWQTLGQEYKDEPAIVHNQGACAEASSLFGQAQSLYAQAADLSARLSPDGVTADKAFVSALRKLNTQRYGLELIDEVSGIVPEQPTQTPQAGEGS